MSASTAVHIAGRSVSRVGFGCWRFTSGSLDERRTLIEAALDLGINLVDTADVYGLDWGGSGFGACESLLGEVLHAAPALRDRMVLATKGGIVPGVPYDSSAATLTAACEASLRRLRVDHVDLYQVHRPDHFTHPAELAATLQSLVDRGLVGAVGLSNTTAAQTAPVRAHLDAPLASVQPEFSVLQLAPLRDGVLDDAMTHNTAVLAWSPLGGGRIATGDGCPPALLAALDDLASGHRVSRAVIALAFVLTHPSAPVALVGSQRPERLAEAMQALGVGLDRASLYRLVEASDGRPLP